MRMKNFIKRFITVLMLVAIMVTCLPLTAEAATQDGTMGGPFKLGTGGKYTKTWSKYNDEVVVSFKMSKKGYATITTTKIKNSKGNVIPYEYYLYDSKGNLVWDCMTEGQASKSGKKNTNKVGLKKGTYRLKVDPQVTSGDIGKKTTITVKTTANDGWEVESNENLDKANTIKVGKKVVGVYGENKANHCDCFKVKLTAGKTYKISISNAGKLFKKTTLCDIYDPSKTNQVTIAGNAYKKAGYTLKQNGTVTIVPTKTGYYYIKLWNEFGYKFPGVQYGLTVKQL